MILLECASRTTALAAINYSLSCSFEVITVCRNGSAKSFEFLPSIFVIDLGQFMLRAQGTILFEFVISASL